MGIASRAPLLAVLLVAGTGLGAATARAAGPGNSLPGNSLPGFPTSPEAPQAPPAALGCAGSYSRVDVAFDWFDTSGGFIDSSFTDDHSTQTALPFPFDYGDRYTRITISSNGWLSFTEPEEGQGGDPAWQHDPIPDASSPAGVIAPFWRDLDPTLGATIQRDVQLQSFGVAPRRVFVVTFDQFPAHMTPSSSYTFQVAFYETTNVIRFQYLQMTGNQTLMTIGVENRDGTAGIQYSFNQSRSLAARAMEFRPTFPALPDCNFSTPLACGSTLRFQAGASSVNLQYGCSDANYPAFERNYELNLPAATIVDIQVAASDGDPTRTFRAFLMSACDLCHCIEGPAAHLRTMLGPGRYYLVIDGEQLSDNVPFDVTLDCEVALGNPTGTVLHVGDTATCGDLTLDFDRFADGRSVWTRSGWINDEQDRTFHALRIDGNAIFTTSPNRSQCTPFYRMAAFVDDDTDTAVSYYRSSAGEVVQTVYGTVVPGPGCCGIRIDTRVRNTDTVPHFYDFRTLYAVDFGPGVQTCSGDPHVEAGPLHVEPNAIDYTTEQNLACDPTATPPGICATACGTPAELKSADDLQLKYTVQLIGPSTPDAVTGGWVHYDEVNSICQFPGPDLWMGGWGPVGEPNAACTNFNGLVYAWRVPQGTQTSCAAPGDCLAPGAEASFTHFFGNGCRMVACSNCFAAASLVIPQTRMCIGNSVTLDATGSQVTGCPGTVTYTWERDGQPTGISTSTYVANEPAPGSHDYRVTVSCEPPPGSICTDTRAASVVWSDCASCAITPVISGVTTACLGDTVTLDGTGSAINNCPGTVTWQWSRNFVPIPGASFPTLAVSETALGTYVFTLAVACSAPPQGLNCQGTSNPFSLTYEAGGTLPLDRGNSLLAAKLGAHVILSWTRPPDGSQVDEILRGTSKLELLPPGPPLLVRVPTPRGTDTSAVVSPQPFLYRVRGRSCLGEGPY